MTGRWSQNNIRRFIKFAHPVKSCVYNKETDDFTVIVKVNPWDCREPAPGLGIFLGL